MRCFLKQSNELKLAPVVKDVFLYYESRSAYGSDGWLCPDTTVAEEIGRSRNAVCEARAKLKEIGWVDEPTPFLIVITREFDESERRLSESERRLSESEGRLSESERRLPFKEKNTLKKKEEKRRGAATAASRSKRASRIPPGFTLTPELDAWTRAERPGLNITKELENFRDHWVAEPGQKGLKLDWPATWRKWIRNCRYGFAETTQKGEAASGIAAKEKNKNGTFNNTQYKSGGDDTSIARLQGQTELFGRFPSEAELADARAGASDLGRD